jgi:precorrin-6B methylase 2
MIKTLNFFRYYLISAIKIIYYFLFGWAYKEGRKKLTRIIASAQKLPKEKRKLETLDFKNIVNENVTVNISQLFGVNGNTSLYELIVISGIVKNKNPLTILEIGTFDGRTTLNFALNTLAECKIYTLDLPPSEKDKTSFAIEENEMQYINKPESGARFKNFSDAGKIIQLFGDSATFDFSVLPKADLIFIDGSHAYDYVINDSLKCFQMLKPNGIMLWHDYGVWEGVTKGLEFLKETNPSFKSISYIRETSLAYLAL